MITEQEAKDLIAEYKKLKDIHDKTKERLAFYNLKKHERICVQKFEYLITMNLNRYKAFHNYEDLIQEGYEGLFMAMKTYKSDNNYSPFYWIHRYVKTRLQRNASNHSVIRFPMKFAKENIPHRESFMPIMIDKGASPLMELQNKEYSYLANKCLSSLDEETRKLISMIYGIDSEVYSINKICKEKSISRTVCLKQISDAIEIMKEKISDIKNSDI